MKQGTHAGSKVMPIFFSLLKEVKPTSLVWEENGEVFTAEEVLEHMNTGAALGVRYAQHILQGMMQGFSEQSEAIVPEASSLDVTVPVQESLSSYFRTLPEDTVVWVTMSRKFKAGEMPSLLEQADKYVKILVEDMMRITRDNASAVACH